MYKEIKPSKGIDTIIDSFWTFSKNKTSANFKVLPDACMDLIFDLSKNRGFLSGVMTTYQFSELTPETDLIGIRFKTENFGAICKIPLNETKNLRVELSELFTAKRLERLYQLNELETIPEKVHFLENFIDTSFKQNMQEQDHIVLSVARSVRVFQGVVNVEDLAKSHHISLRQLERRFKSYVGLTVKEFSNIIRFINAKQSIANHTNSSLLEIACDRGFFDHSHMTNEFKRISGENPSFFR